MCGSGARALLFGGVQNQTMHFEAFVLGGSDLQDFGREPQFSMFGIEPSIQRHRFVVQVLVSSRSLALVYAGYVKIQI